MSSVASNKKVAPLNGRAAQQRELRARVIKEATTLFAERGFENTRLSDIADRVGIVKGNILYHFGSKEDLWKSVYDACVHELEESFEDHLELETVEDLCRLVSKTINAYLRTPAFVRISALESVAEGWRSRYIGERTREHFAIFATTAQRLMATGALPPVDPLALQTIMYGSYQFIFAMAPTISVATGRDVTSDEFVRSFVDTINLLCKSI